MPIIHTNTCIYWDYDDTKHEQECGYCHYIRKGDWEINDKAVLQNCKTGKKERARDIGLPVGLLWDKCKECGINDEMDEIDEKEI